MTITRFIEKAIEGGWKSPNTAIGYESHGGVYEEKDRDNLFSFEDVFLVQEILLDPLAWQAVGKVEGWDNTDDCICSVTMEKAERNPVFLADCLCHREAAFSWHMAMHRLIDALAEGKTLEQFIETL